jgi:hypothetical protein
MSKATKVVVGVVAAAAIAVVGVLPAQASEGGVQGCGFGPANPVREGNQVVGRSSSWGCELNWRFTSTLQRNRWWGWENLADQFWTGDAASDRRFDCTGSGTYTYRVRLGWDNGVGGAGTQYSGEFTTTC